jgi:histidinol-phosphate phosphatase family protein
MSIFKKLNVDKSWTLFLDRDGVINLHFPKDYVKNWDEFFFLDGALEAIKRFSSIFGRIVVVTNQQGVGKGKMTEDTLQSIHINMLNEIENIGGRLDSIYSATSLVNDDEYGLRKPKIGMALQAQIDFPEIDFAKSIIVGDSITDMEFGRNAGMFTVFVATTHPETPYPESRIDLRLNSLYEFSEACEKVIKR